MTLDEIMERTKIEFPKELSLEETERLVEYIAEKLPADISGQASYHFSLYHEEKEISKSGGSVYIGGTIRSLKDAMAFDCFQTYSPVNDCTKISGFTFTRTPGWDLGEYRPELLKLWDDVRGIVEQHFDPKYSDTLK